jgi:leucyl-tRNA synthetase
MRQRLGKEGSILRSKWPAHDKSAIAEDVLTIPIQINGRLRSRIEVSAAITEEALKSAVLSDPGIQNWLQSKPVKKVIIVPKKLVNIVI